MVEELADGVLPAASRNQASSLSLVEPVALEAFPPLRPTAGWRPRWRASMEGTVFRVEMCTVQWQWQSLLLEKERSYAFFPIVSP